MIRKVVIASDSFKGSLSSRQVAKAVATGIRRAFPECEAIGLRVADGGEGTAKAIASGEGWKRMTVIVHDPLGRPVEAEYFKNDGRTAVMEMAAASGLTLLQSHERNPLLTSTFGTGEMIIDAIRHGCRKITVGIGGSATNDGGTGMLEALGFRFTDKDGRRITRLCGARLADIAGIDSSNVRPEIAETAFTIACDVESPFCGPDGAARIFGPQKGADADAVETLEAGMQSLNSTIFKKTGIDLSATPGAGAAGGLAGAFTAFLGARQIKGIDAVLDTIGFDDMIKDADLVITGEGKLDGQTVKGKVVSGVTKRANRHSIPVLAIAGIVELEADTISRSGLAAAYPIGPRPQNESDLEVAMRPEVASKRIAETVARALESLSPSLYREIL